MTYGARSRAIHRLGNRCSDLRDGVACALMQALACISSLVPRIQNPKSSAKRLSTNERLLDAAAWIFARDGLSGATTKEIARAAGVNEVTLFRHFQSKGNLVSAVAERMCGVVSGSQFEPKAASSETAEPAVNEPQDVAGILFRFAEIYYSLLSEHLPLIRTFIGEIHRHRGQEESVIKSIFRPQRHQFVEQLKAAQARGQIRENVNLVMAADQLSGMIFTNVLRQKIFLPNDYTPHEYLAACVAMVADNIKAREGVAAIPPKHATEGRARPASRRKGSPRE